MFINFGFLIITATGMFNDTFTTTSGMSGTQLKNASKNYSAIQNFLINPVFQNAEGIKSIPGLGTITGMQVLVIAFIFSTAVVLYTQVISPTGVAIGAFSFIFWGNIIMVGISVFTYIDIPGREWFYGLFFAFCGVTFIMALIQMTTGGQKNHA